MRARFDNSHCECSIIFSVCDKLYLLCSRIIFSLVWQIYCAAILTADHACVFVKYVGLRCRKIEPLRLDASYADYGNHHHVLPAHMQTPCLFMGQEQGILIPEPVFLLWGCCGAPIIPCPSSTVTKLSLNPVTKLSCSIQCDRQG